MPWFGFVTCDRSNKAELELVIKKLVVLDSSTAMIVALMFDTFHCVML